MLLGGSSFYGVQVCGLAATCDFHNGRLDALGAKQCAPDMSNLPDQLSPRCLDVAWHISTSSAAVRAQRVYICLLPHPQSKRYQTRNERFRAAVRASAKTALDDSA